MKREINSSHSSDFWATISFLMLILLSLFAASDIFGQSSAVEAFNKKKPKLEISVSDSGEITLKATKANTTELAAELSRRLKIPVILSELMREKTADIAYYDLPLEEAARQLAPHVRIDYVLRQKENGELVLRPLAIYLSGYNESEPATVQSAETEQQTIVIEGGTETIEEAGKGRNLKINFSDNRLTVFARRQNLSFLVSEIAARANLEFDLRYDEDKLINIEIQNEPLAEALARLSPQVRVYLRSDLLTGKVTPFRVALTEPGYQIKKTR